MAWELASGSRLKICCSGWYKVRQHPAMGDNWVALRSLSRHNPSSLSASLLLAASPILRSVCQAGLRPNCVRPLPTRPHHAWGTPQPPAWSGKGGRVCGACGRVKTREFGPNSAIFVIYSSNGVDRTKKLPKRTPDGRVMVPAVFQHAGRRVAGPRPPGHSPDPFPPSHVASLLALPPLVLSRARRRAHACHATWLWLPAL